MSQWELFPVSSKLHWVSDACCNLYGLLTSQCVYVCVWGRDRERQRKRILRATCGRCVMRNKELMETVWSLLPTLWCGWDPRWLVPLLCPNRSRGQRCSGRWRGSIHVGINLHSSCKLYLLSPVSGYWSGSSDGDNTTQTEERKQKCRRKGWSNAGVNWWRKDPPQLPP